VVGEFVAVFKTHDAGFRVQSSTPVSQVENARPRITRRSEVHVKVGSTDAKWHRPMLDPRGLSGPILMTACELTLAGKYYATRHESYEGELCTNGCFTPAELRIAAEYAADAERRRAEEAARDEAEREKWYEENEKRRTDKSKALKKPDDTNGHG
jgi:hypothetical protein